MAGCDKKFKLMMLGDAGVGKTTSARRFVDQVCIFKGVEWPFTKHLQPFTQNIILS